jgi:hypothetical protein
MTFLTQFSKDELDLDSREASIIYPQNQRQSGKPFSLCTTGDDSPRSGKQVSLAEHSKTPTAGKL